MSYQAFFLMGDGKTAPHFKPVGPLRKKGEEAEWDIDDAHVLEKYLMENTPECHYVGEVILDESGQRVGSFWTDAYYSRKQSG